MNSKQRMCSIWGGQPADYVPLTMWCFGFPAPPGMGWERDGQPVEYWYTKRLEHIHCLPQTWELEDDFKRVLAWKSLGVDDVLEVSIPWSVAPDVTWTDTRLDPGVTGGDEHYHVQVREYVTPAGNLRHAVRITGEDAGPGWPVQAEYVPLLDDFNIPRGVEHAVASIHDVPLVDYLYRAPDNNAREWFASRMDEVGSFARQHNVPIRAWAAFGMDAVVWMMGAEGAIMMALDQPREFERLMEIVAKADYGRVELAASNPDVDIIAQRGWYSSTDFWSPAMFDQFVFPHLEQLTSLAHRHGKKYMYTMETGGLTLGPRLADAGVDVLYGVDPVLDKLSLEQVRDKLCDRLTVVGGTHSMTLASRDTNRIRDEVRRAIDVLGPTNRFVLHPLDSLFPDTPWESVLCLIDAWKEYTH